MPALRGARDRDVLHARARPRRPADRRARARRRQGGAARQGAVQRLWPQAETRLMHQFHFFPSRTMALYMGRLFFVRTFAILFALVVILQTLDLLGESGKILAVAGNGDAEVWPSVGDRKGLVVGKRGSGR